jgi:hypothetical protein
VRRPLRAAWRAVPGDSRAGGDQDHVSGVLPDHPGLHTGCHGEANHTYLSYAVLFHRKLEELMNNVAESAYMAVSCRNILALSI